MQTAQPNRDTLTPRHQRVRGHVRVGLVAGPRGPGARLRDLYQAGAAKAFLPRVHADIPEVVLLNTAGGLTAGDRMAVEINLGAGAEAVVTTQTAERAYGSLAAGPAAQVRVRMEVGAGARLLWLPQETIVFDRARLDRRTEIHLAAEARCLSVETLVLGRAAMGERVTELALRDWRGVFRNGQPVLVEPLALDGAQLLPDAGPAVLAGATTLSTVWLVDPAAAARLAPLRRLLNDAPEGVRAAASAWDGRLVLRAMAPAAAPLRQLIGRALALLGDRPLPRVWAL